MIDAILGISVDDTPSNLAAAALVYLLTSDVSDLNYALCHTLYLFFFTFFFLHHYSCYFEIFENHIACSSAPS